MTKKVRKGLSALNKARRFHATFNFAKFLTSLRIEIHTFRTPLNQQHVHDGIGKGKVKIDSAILSSYCQLFKISRTV